MMKYTLVEHNGLPNMVMILGVKCLPEKTRVEKVGGLLFETFDEALAGEYQENYPGEDGEKGEV